MTNSKLIKNNISTFLLSWDSDLFPWDDIQELSQLVQSGKSVTITWNCGKYKKIQKNDRIFLIKINQYTRGIFASGFASRVFYKKLKDFDNKEEIFVDIQLDTLLNPISHSSVLFGGFAKYFGDQGQGNYRSVTEFPNDSAGILEDQWHKFTNHQKFISPEEIQEEKEIYEGSVTKIKVNTYERNIQARRKCITHYGTNCCVCSFDFSQVFGDLGEGFIHVHHLRPLSEIKEEYQVDPINDLRPICPNCHAMIHRKSPPLTIEELQDILRQGKH